MSISNNQSVLKAKLQKWVGMLEEMPYQIPNAGRLSGTDRGIILIGSIYRATALTKAVLLLSEHEFSEESVCLSRTLAELVINALYLQIADQSEVVRFKNVDVLEKRKLLDEWIRFAGTMNRSEALTSDEYAAVERATEEAREAIGDAKLTVGWSSMDVASRAVRVDYHMRGTLARTILKAAYTPAHSAVHSTWASLNSVTRQGDTAGTARTFEAVDICLTALATFVEIEYFAKAT